MVEDSPLRWPAEASTARSERAAALINRHLDGGGGWSLGKGAHSGLSGGGVGGASAALTKSQESSELDRGKISA